MINAKKVYNEILSDPILIEMVGEDSIMDSYPDEVVKFPWHWAPNLGPK